MKNCYLVKKVSRKEGKEPFPYVQLYVDTGYSKLTVSMDKNVISELLECAVSQLYSIEEEKPVLVATLTKQTEGKKNAN